MVSALAVGCGSPDPGPVTPAEAADECRTICTHSAACETPPQAVSEQCVADCMNRVSGWLRADALATVADCLDGAACSVREESCYPEVAPLAIDHQWEDRCREVMSACGTAEELELYCDVDSPASDGALIVLFTPAIVDDMIACFDQPGCDAVDACMSSIIDMYLGGD